MSTAHKTLLALVAAGVLVVASQLAVDHWSPALAAAETIRTSKSARVLSGPRPTGRVIARIAAGRDLEVLARKGRWIKVRASGKTGWITASSAKSTRSARTTVTRTKRRPVVERRSETRKRKAVARSKPDPKPKPKQVATRVAPPPPVKKTKRPANLEDDEELLVGEEIDAEVERKRVAALEREEQLRREREAREQEEREAERRKRQEARAERERRDRERQDRELEERRREQAARRDREDRERKRRPVRGGDYETFDLDDDDDDDDGDRRAERDRVERDRVERDRVERDRVERDRSRRDDDDDDDDLDEEEEDRGPARRRVVVVKGDSTEVRAKPSERSTELGIAEGGEKLVVVRETESGAWMLVEDESGKTGWIRSKDVDGGDQAAAIEAKVVARGGITAGYTSLGSVFTSNGVGELANYEFTTAAASASVGGEIVFEYSPSLMLACDARYTGTRADPGIRFMNGAGDVSDIALTNHEVDAGARLGYRLSGSVGTILYGRVGYHYGMLSIDDVSDFEVNLAMLPSEVLKGMTLGGQIDIARFGSNLGIRVSGDMLYPNGTRIQTDGLEDGAESKVTAAWVTGQITYRTKASIAIELAYRYAFATTDWTGTADHSMRPHEASQASRKDVAHTAMIGIGRSF